MSALCYEIQYIWSLCQFVHDLERLRVPAILALNIAVKLLFRMLVVHDLLHEHLFDLAQLKVSVEYRVPPTVLLLSLLPDALGCVKTLIANGNFFVAETGRIILRGAALGTERESTLFTFNFLFAVGAEN